MTDLMFWARVQHILAETLAALPADDRAERIRWCRENDAHGVRAFPEADGIRFEWGGRVLAVVDRGVFAEDAYLRPLELDMVRDVPDDPRELAGE